MSDLVAVHTPLQRQLLSILVLTHITPLFLHIVSNLDGASSNNSESIQGLWVWSNAFLTLKACQDPAHAPSVRVDRPLEAMIVHCLSLPHTMHHADNFSFDMLL